MKTLAIAIAGVLAAPAAMANCDTQIERIESRVQAADMDPRNETVLTQWLQQQRAEHAGSSAAQCTQLAAEIERQMQEKGYFANASQPRAQPLQSGAQQSGTPQASALQPGQSGIAVEAAPTEVVVQQPAAQIDVQQRPAEVEVQMQQAEVVVQVPDPQVQVTQPAPQVTVNQPDPKVRVVQNDPMVSVNQPEPKVNVTQGEPEVTVQQGEPQVSVREQQAIVDVQQGEPQIEVQQADGGNVSVGESGSSAASAALASGNRSADTIGNTDMQGSPTGSSRAEPARAFATAGEANDDHVAARELVGHTVVDIHGATVGRVTEALKRPGDGQVYVRVDVAASSDLDSEELVLGVDKLERNAGNLLVRGEPGAVLSAAALRQADDLEPADTEQVVLSGEW